MSVISKELASASSVRGMKQQHFYLFIFEIYK